MPVTKSLQSNLYCGNLKHHKLWAYLILAMAAYIMGTIFYANVAENAQDDTRVNQQNYSNTRSGKINSRKIYQERQLNLFKPVFKLPQATIKFNLNLVTANHSVIVTMATENLTEVFALWFIKPVPSSLAVDSYCNTSANCGCRLNSRDNFIVNNLLPNSSYTFCLVYAFKNDVSPFNCLPFYVPSKKSLNESKTFTVGLLAVIYGLTAFLAAFIAYFGIRNYPNILMISKAAFPAKKPEDINYETIRVDNEYRKRSTLSNIKQPSLDKSLLTVTPMDAITAIKLSVSQQNIENFNKTLCSMAEVEYEMPLENERKGASNQHDTNLTTCSTAPKSPPPLPKRNSNVSDA